MNKAWKGRTSNAMKKIHEIYALYGAQTAGLIFDKKTGELMIYESQRGFITLPEGGEIFFHRSAIEGGKELEAGEFVFYEAGSTQRGPAAKSVRAAG